ncbi:MAG: glycosyltransferase family 2 protein [Ilumatobacteraceae bacterium]
MLAVVIVTFSAEAAMLEACVASVLAAGEADHVIVIDNGGSAVVGDGVEVIRPSRNLGFGAGANLGFRRAAELGATSVALLNDDIEVEAGWLGPLQEALGADAALGAVQPKLLLAGSNPPRINSVGVEVGRDGAGTDIGYGEEDGSQFTKERSIESFTGGAVLFRSSFLKNTGGFDESYFLYYEDVDLARRGADLGWTYRCVPASRVWHRLSASTSQLGDRARLLQERNRLRFAFRFGDSGMVARALWLSIRRLRWTPRGAHAMALIAGLASAPATLVARRRAR